MAVVLALATGACSDDDNGGPVTAGPDPSAEPGTVAPTTVAEGAATCPDRPGDRGRLDRRLDFAGERRDYVLYVPDAVDDDPVPVVFNFHGLASSGAQQFVYADLTDEADRAGFVVVAPDGTGTPRRWPLAGFDVSNPDTDSIAFVDALLDELDSTWCVDRQRVYATGLSYGGIMSSALACRAGDRIAAVAPVAGTAWFDDCAGAPPVDLLAFHGTADDVVSFDGSPTALTSALDDGGPPATLGDIATNVAGFVGLAGCEPAAEEDRIADDVTLRSYGCDGTEVGLYVVEGGGHTWPGAVPLPLLGRTTDSVDASALIWAFFERHPLGR